ncbi:MarR family transcriptional regulator [Streptomyces sp. J2-1]|uniref:MarR family winged helix-turn-helix transcriptional regulator n=1 Tax=Streptomyces corallincola TaxID=2851888 RepID=UPI001C391A96|nr:MarR family transcriptional regulator [Streptomyces corallincola]MBV2356866.1 MarR family transcriptional regulator [Streptomyces corallincola]
MDGMPRPPADPAQALSAMDDLIAAHLIGQQEMARRLGLNVTDLTCYGYVLGAGETPPTAGELAARAQVTTGAMTGIVNRLVRAGYVTRRPDPADRRVVRVAPVPGARVKVEAAYAPHYARLMSLFADYSPAELATITDWFTRATAAAHESLRELTREHRPEGA